MAAMHPAVIWLIIAAILGTALLIATFIDNRNQKKKKKGKYFIILWSRPAFGDNIDLEERENAAFELNHINGYVSFISS